MAKKLIGLKAKLYAKKRHSEKVTMKKTIQQHSERTNKHKVEEDAAPGAIPAYLLDREQTSRAKVLSNTIKQKRKEKAGKWEVPLPKVRPVAEDEMFRVMRSGKRQKKSWKRMITKATFVGPGFTRKPPKYERFIRPSGLRFTKAHVTHPELKCTFQLDILGVKKNPNGPMYSSLGVLTKGTVIEVNVSELGAGHEQPGERWVRQRGAARVGEARATREGVFVVFDCLNIFSHERFQTNSRAPPGNPPQRGRKDTPKERHHLRTNSL